MAIERGDIYFVDVNPIQGREQAGHRPVVVLSLDAINKLPLVVTVVVGTRGQNITRDYPTNVRVAPGRVVCHWKRCFCASRSRRWIAAGSPALPQAELLAPPSRRSGLL